jgi:Transposase Tn5 dimerisation domain
MPIESAAQAWERVDWYRCRWTAEDYHQGLKTGCRVEQRHLRDYESLRRFLGFLGPSAVRLLQLRALARLEPERPASSVLPVEVVQVVAALLQAPSAQLTAQQAWYKIASYGGYQGRKSDGPPGWKTLWKGWFYVQALVEGVHLASQLSLD